MTMQSHGSKQYKFSKQVYLADFRYPRLATLTFLNSPPQEWSSWVSGISRENKGKNGDLGSSISLYEYALKNPATDILKIYAPSYSRRLEFKKDSCWFC
jgi:hypothetical protein